MKDTIMNYISYTFYFQSNINLVLKCYGILVFPYCIQYGNTSYTIYGITFVIFSYTISY